MNEWVYISGYGSVQIGNKVRIGSRTTILSSDHSFRDGSLPIYQQPLAAKPTVIEDNVFIGCNAVILGGVTIGSGSVIGAGSIVTKDVPRAAIVAGNPARQIGQTGYGRKENDKEFCLTG